MSPYEGLHISAFSKFVSSPFKSRTEYTHFEQDLCVHRTKLKLLMDVSSS